MESSELFNGNNSISDLRMTIDSLGRMYVAQVREGPGSSTYDSVDVQYNSDGLRSATTMPYAGSAGQTKPSGPYEKAEIYDALGRATQTTSSGGLVKTISYTANDVYVAVGPAPAGENQKREQLEYDALGRLTSVCEVTAGTVSAPAGNCSQTSPQTGYWTQYQYDLNNKLTGVSQNAQSSSPQSRSFTYDSMGRLTSEINPESGTTTYTYDTDSTCGTYKGDLVKKVDAIGNITCYAYDASHRVMSRTFSGQYASVTPGRYFVYDSATVNSVTMANAKGRMAEAYTCFSPCSTKLTDIGFSYTARGEVTDMYESTPNSGGYYHSSATYWENRAPKLLTNSAGYYFLYGLDGRGRVNSATDGGGAHPLASTAYNAASQPTLLSFGSSDTDTYNYDPNTGRMTQYQFNVGTLHQALTGKLAWNSNGSLQNLTTEDLYNNAGTQSCNYQHDDLSRIANVNCPGNQLQNSGFESGNVAWSLSGSWSIVNNAANAQSGSWYLSGSSTSPTAASANAIPVTPGQVITTGGWIKRTGGTGILDWGCWITDANHNFLTWCNGAILADGSGGTSWQLYTAQTTMPTNAAYIQLTTEVHGFADTDTSQTSGYFDSAFVDGASVWQQTFAYDSFGNINKTGNSSFNPSYSSTTNRMNQIGSSTPTYDANGNVTNDFLHTYAWDANGRPVTIDGVGVTYDALGRMVEQNRSGTYTQFEYSPTGFVMHTLHGQAPQIAFSPLPAGANAIYTATGLAYRHADWLGSARLVTNPNQTVAGDVAYAPFGETYASSGTPWLSFTGIEQDTSSNLYDFPAREYGIQGRWPSPDPAGMSSVSLSDPQTLNRYAYVRNSPLNSIDALGLNALGNTYFDCTGGCTYSPDDVSQDSFSTGISCCVDSNDPAGINNLVPGPANATDLGLGAEGPAPPPIEATDLLGTSSGTQTVLSTVVSLSAPFGSETGSTQTNVSFAGSGLVGAAVPVIGRLADTIKLLGNPDYNLLYSPYYEGIQGDLMQARWMEEIIASNSDVQIVSDLTADNMVGHIFGDEVSELMNSGWTLDIENSTLLAPESLEPALGWGEVYEGADIIAGVAEGFEGTDALLLLLLL